MTTTLYWYIYWYEVTKSDLLGERQHRGCVAPSQSPMIGLRGYTSERASGERPAEFFFSVLLLMYRATTDSLTFPVSV